MMIIFRYVLLACFIANLGYATLVLWYTNDTITSYQYQLNDYKKNLIEWPLDKQGEIKKIIEAREIEIPVYEYNEKIAKYNLFINCGLFVLLILFLVFCEYRKRIEIPEMNGKSDENKRQQH